MNANAIAVLDAEIKRAEASAVSMTHAAQHSLRTGAARQAQYDNAAKARARADGMREARAVVGRAYDEMGKAAAFLSALGREDRAEPLRSVMAEMQSPVEAMEGRPA